MAEHRSLTDTEIHEPKGISLAQDKQIYVSDGAGSGVWTTLPTGWGFYQDAGAGQVFNTTASILTNDKAGSSTEESYLPYAIRGSGTLFDSNKITPIALADTYELRLDLPITAKTGSPNFLTLEFDISGTSSPSIPIVERLISVSSTAPYVISVGFPVFVGNTFISNGGQFFLSTDTGSVTITNPELFITRMHGEV